MKPKEITKRADAITTVSKMVREKYARTKDLECLNIAIALAEMGMELMEESRNEPNMDTAISGGRYRDSAGLHNI